MTQIGWYNTATYAYTIIIFIVIVIIIIIISLAFQNSTSNGYQVAWLK